MIQATNTRYIVEPIEQERASAGGIILKHSTETQFAKVIAVGSKVVDPVAVGATVAVEWQHTVPIKHDDKTYFVIESKCVMAEVV